MQIREPLEITCPNCEHHFECSLALILREDQVCPECSASLASIRDRFERYFAGFPYYMEDIERMMMIRREFRIAIPDAEWEFLETFANVHADLIRRLGIDTQDPQQTQQVWDRLCAVVLANPACHVDESPTGSTPFIRTKFSTVYVW
jgi:hypothetical protein